MHWLPEFTETDVFLLDVSLKAALLLAVAWAAAQTLQVCRSSPASRHAVWALAIGACRALGPAILGLVSLWRLGWSSRRVHGGPLSAALKNSMARLGMKRSIRLLESHRRYMPMTWGLWRPTILLPAQARHWSSD